jgi:hypothetical protein
MTRKKEMENDVEKENEKHKENVAEKGRGE